MRMLRTPLVCAAALLLFAAGVAVASRPQGEYQVKFESGLKLTMADGVVLGADGYIPVPNDNTTRFPVLVFPNSWGMPQFEYVVKTLNYAQTGYIAIEYETRGWYASGGEIDVAGPLDLADGATVLDYVASRQDWFPDTDNMAFVGISYGAGIALSMAGSDPRVKTAVVMSGWGNLTDTMMSYNTPNKVWGDLLVEAAEILGHPPVTLSALYNDVMNHNNISFVVDFCAKRSPLRFLETLNSRGTPIFMSHNRLDRLFRSDLALELFGRLNTTNKFLMVNVGVHAEPEAFGDLDLGKNGIWINARMWLDHYLLGRETDITQMPPLQMQLGDSMSATTYLGFKSWPDPTIQEQQFVLNPRGGNHFGSMTAASSQSSMQRRVRGGDGDETISYSILPGLTTGVAFVTGLARSVGVLWDTEILLTPTETAMIWRSEPLSQTTRYCGVPKLNLTVVANQPNWQVYAFLYDIDAVDVAYLISNTYYTNYGIATASNATQLKDLHFHQTCRDFPGGHRIGVGVVLYCDLYQQAATDGLKVTFEYGGFDASLSMPLVQW